MSNLKINSTRVKGVWLEMAKLELFKSLPIYEENEIFLRSMSECELCKHKIHSNKDHTFLYNRAYSRLNDYKPDAKYRRASYTSNNDKIKNLLQPYYDLGIITPKHTDKVEYTRGKYNKKTNNV